VVKEDYLSQGTPFGDVTNFLKDVNQEKKNPLPPPIPSIQLRTLQSK